MQATEKTVQDFLVSIEFGKYADADQIIIRKEAVTVTLKNIYIDLQQAHKDLAKKFNFESVENKSKTS